MKRSWGAELGGGVKSFLSGDPNAALGNTRDPGVTRHVEVALLSLFGLVASFLLFLRLGEMAFIDPDEGRYALVAKEMWQHGNWLRATLNLAPYPDKPAPFFWLLGALIQAPGPAELWGRLISVLPALAILVLVFRWARLRLGFASAIWSVAVLLTAGEFFALSRIVRMDTLLTLAVSAALFGGYEILAGTRDGRWWAVYLWAALGLLVKGPVAPALIGAVLAAYAMAAGASHRLRDLRPVSGLALVGAIAGAWYLPALLADPAGMSAFIFKHNVARFLTARVGHPEPWYFFLWVLPACFMPWSIFLPPAIRRGAAKARAGNRPYLFLAVWCLTIFSLFSLSRAKLAPYILPMFPPLAIITGDTIVALWERAREGQAVKALRGGSVAWAAICGVGTAVALGGALVGPSLTAVPFLSLSAVLLGSAIAALVMFSRGRERLLPCGVFATSVAIFTLCAARGPQLMSELASLRAAAASVATLPASTRVYAYKAHGYSLSFYSGRRITQLNTAAKAAALLDHPEPRAVLIKRKHLARLQEYLSLPVPVWWRGNSAKVLLANRRPPQGYLRYGLLLPAYRGQSIPVAWPSDEKGRPHGSPGQPVRLGASSLADLLASVTRPISRVARRAARGWVGPH